MKEDIALRCLLMGPNLLFLVMKSLLQWNHVIQQPVGFYLNIMLYLANIKSVLNKYTYKCYYFFILENRTTSLKKMEDTIKPETSKAPTVFIYIGVSIVIFICFCGGLLYWLFRTYSRKQGMCASFYGRMHCLKAYSTIQKFCVIWLRCFY